MRIALLDARQGDRTPENSSTVAYRNMLVLRDELGADLFVSAAQLARAPDDYDAIICGFGSTSTEKEQSVAFLMRNPQARLYWLVGEYEQSTFAPLFYAKRKYHVLRNYEHEMRNKWADGQTFVNLNALLAAPAPTGDWDRAYPGVYYGRWREDRSIYLSRYMQGDVYLSTSPKNMKIFSAHGCRPKWARALAWERNRETLRLFSASLYIEDVYTHSHYNCPANRYYEALKCGVPILSQPEARGTWDKAGIALGNWRLVRNAQEFASKSLDLMRDAAMRREVLAEQAILADVAMQERASVLQTIRSVIQG